MSMTDELVIDDSLYSRQQLMMGEAAMKRMAASNVFLSGLSGLGVEIAKNVALAGVKSLTLHDTLPASFFDLSTNFYIAEEDLKDTSRTRADICLSKVHELNPYTKCTSSSVDLQTNLSVLDEFKCVILVDCPLDLQKTVNKYCHSRSIRFISAESRGVFAWSFCDFGDDFEIFDKNGEESKEALIAGITKAKEGVVSTLNDTRHDFEDGDTVTFREVLGMKEVNEVQFEIKVLSPTTFSIGDTTSFGDYQREGIATQVKTVTKTSHLPLEASLLDPNITPTDFAKLEVGPQIHLGNLAVHHFCSQNGRPPAVWDKSDAEKIVQIAGDINNNTLKNKIETVDTNLIEKMSFTFQGSLAPISSFMGGVVAQECLKALSGKYTPLNQWVYFDAMEVLPSEQSDTTQFTPTSSRYDGQRICVGEKTVDQLLKTKLFMVGCGAIGCEMMKNYALMGIACGGGEVHVTDNDLIEKSNLNRQFLFRAKDIQVGFLLCVVRTCRVTVIAVTSCETNTVVTVIQLDPAGA